MRYPTTSARFCRILCAAVLLLLGMLVAPVSAADAPPGTDADSELPRYKFEVGQELVYRLTEDVDLREPKDATPTNAAPQKEWRVFVDRKNDDGSLHLFIRTKIKFFNADGSPRTNWDSLDYCDLQPDGSYAANEQTLVFNKLFPYKFFCRLPNSTAERESTWKFKPPVMGSEFTYRLAKLEGALWKVAGTEQDIYSEVNKWRSVFTYSFNTERGIVERSVEEFTHLDTKQVRSRSTIQLLSTTQHDAAWVANFRDETQTYRSVYAKWVKLVYEAYRAHDLAECTTALEKARKVLIAGREAAKSELVLELYDAHLRAHEKEEASTPEIVKQREKFFAAAREFPTNWEAKNFDGSTFRLAEHRGQVVVLYFWSMGCEYCVLAAPQMTKMAADAQRKNDFNVVGMFVRFGYEDEDSGAKTYVERTYRGFPHLEGKQIADLYAFTDHHISYPATVVLDQSGRVREVFVGYSADLGEQVNKVVDNLRRSLPAKAE